LSLPRAGGQGTKHRNADRPGPEFFDALLERRHRIDDQNVSGLEHASALFHR
jgi:hypothetical protein